MVDNGRYSLKNLRELLRQELEECLVRRDDPTNRFAPREATGRILHKETLVHLFTLIVYGIRPNIEQTAVDCIRSLAFKVNDGSYSSPSFCNVLAILVYARCKNRTIESFLNRLLNDPLVEEISDGNLPLAKTRAISTFGIEDGLAFWSNQYPFCPVVLREYGKSVYGNGKAHCPLPFLEDPEKVGEGSYSTVFEVKVVKRHLVNHKSSASNDRTIRLAQKVFKDYDARAREYFDAEVAVSKAFIEANKHHSNITVSRASLERGNSYSLFFDLAKYNLWEYFHDKEVTLKTLEDRGVVFGNFIGVAGALAYLHNELFLGPTAEQVCCYHLDLKPQNILVFEENGVQLWKISDFGISTIKKVQPTEAKSKSQGSKTAAFLKVLRNNDSNIERSSGVPNSRYEGTYTAPEARKRSDTVTRASDVWSLGCILALVLTFMDNPRTGIGDFSDFRLEGKSDDFFYDVSPCSMLRWSVHEWFHRLSASAVSRGEAEAEAVAAAIKLLKCHMLTPDLEKRYPVTEVEKELKRLQPLFAEPSYPQEVQTRHVEKDHRPIAKSFWDRRIVGRKLQHDKPEQRWSFRLPDSWNRCSINHDGTFIVVESNLSMTTLNISAIQQHRADSSVEHPILQAHRLGDHAIGSGYACVASDVSHFEFTYIPLEDGNSNCKSIVYTSIPTPIQKIILSPDDSITGVIIKETKRGVAFSRLVLYLTADVIESLSQSEAHTGNRPQRGFNRSEAAKHSESLPWKNLLTNPHDGDFRFSTDILDMQFSKDGQILMAMTKPYTRGNVRSYQYDILTWDVLEGRRITMIENRTSGYDGMTHTWSLNAFATFTDEPLFAAISTKKIRIGDYTAANPEDSTRTSNSLSDTLLGVDVDQDGRELIIIGRGHRGNIKIYMHHRDRIEGLENLDQCINTGLAMYNPVTDTLRLIRTQDGRRAILIATLRGKVGELSLHYLDDIKGKAVIR